MAQKQTSGERSEIPSFLNLTPAELAETGKKRMESLLQAQGEILDAFQQANRQWLERIQSETALASEFSAKLTAARSFPEAVTACQDYTKRLFEMMAEDGEHLLADSKALIETGARLMASGWASKQESARK